MVSNILKTTAMLSIVGAIAMPAATAQAFSPSSSMNATSVTNTNGDTVFNFGTSQGAEDFLHAWYCAHQTLMLRDTCENTPLTAAQRNAFRDMYATWMTTMQNSYELMIQNESSMETDTDGGSSSSSSSNSDDDAWRNSANAWWTARGGEYIAIRDGMLVWSMDNGTTWTPVPEKSWQTFDGDWYRFTDDWNLQMSRNGGVTWTQSDDKMWPDQYGNWYRLDTSKRLEVREGKGSLVAIGQPTFDAEERQEEVVEDYEACKHISPRRYTTCIDEREQAREENMEMDQ